MSLDSSDSPTNQFEGPCIADSHDNFPYLELFGDIGCFSDDDTSVGDTSVDVFIDVVSVSEAVGNPIGSDIKDVQNQEISGEDINDLVPSATQAAVDMQNVLAEHNPNVVTTHHAVRSTDQSLSSKMPPDNILVVDDSSPTNTIVDNLTMPAQTQALANVQWVGQSVCDNGTEQYSNQSAQIYDAQFPVTRQQQATNDDNTGTGYHSNRADTILLENLNPSFLPNSIHTCTPEGKISQASDTPENLSLPGRQHTPSTITRLPSHSSPRKRQREDDVITHYPRKHQIRPFFPSVPSLSQSTPPTWCRDEEGDREGGEVERRESEEYGGYESVKEACEGAENEED